MTTRSEILRVVNILVCEGGVEMVLLECLLACLCGSGGQERKGMCVSERKKRSN
jgi:hypothetical protein